MGRGGTENQVTNLATRAGDSCRSQFARWCEYTGNDYSLAEGRRFAVLVEPALDYGRRYLIGAADSTEEALELAKSETRGSDSSPSMLIDLDSPAETAVRLIEARTTYRIWDQVVALDESTLDGAEAESVLIGQQTLS